MSQPPQSDNYSVNLRPEVIPYIPLGARRVIDVGCGPGGFGASLRNRLGTAAYLLGVDAVERSADAARASRNYDEVVQGYFPEIVADKEPFDVIVFNDVLEHTIDPWRMLVCSRSLLTPSGVVVAAIPNIQFAPVLLQLIRGRWDYAEAGVLDKTHLRFFTRPTMTEMFEECGFTVHSCEGVNSIKGYWASTTSPKDLLRRLMLRWRPELQFPQFVVVARAR